MASNIFHVFLTYDPPNRTMQPWVDHLTLAVQDEVKAVRKALTMAGKDSPGTGYRLTTIRVIPHHLYLPHQKS